MVVIDGDTLDVEISGSVTPKERIRLLRINTPERDEPGFERSTAALKALVEGRKVELRFEDPGRAQRDDYGRLLAYVVVDGVDVNLEMVRRGFTRFFTKYGEGRFADAYRKAEEEARAGNAGLWSAAGWNMLGRDEPRLKRRKRLGPRPRLSLRPIPSRRARRRAASPLRAAPAARATARA